MWKDVEFLVFCYPYSMWRRFLVVNWKTTLKMPTPAGRFFNRFRFLCRTQQFFYALLFLDDEYEEVEDVLLGLFGGVFAGTLNGAVPVGTLYDRTVGFDLSLDRPRNSVSHIRRELCQLFQSILHGWCSTTLVPSGRV